MSPIERRGCLSTDDTGLTGNLRTCWARRMTTRNNWRGSASPTTDHRRCAFL